MGRDTYLLPALRTTEILVQTAFIPTLPILEAPRSHTITERQPSPVLLVPLRPVPGENPVIRMHHHDQGKGIDRPEEKSKDKQKKNKKQLCPCQLIYPVPSLHKTIQSLSHLIRPTFLFLNTNFQPPVHTVSCPNFADLHE